VIDPESFSEEKVKEIREEVRGSKVIAAREWWGGQHDCCGPGIQSVGR